MSVLIKMDNEEAELYEKLKTLDVCSNPEDTQLDKIDLWRTLVQIKDNKEKKLDEDKLKQLRKILCYKHSEPKLSVAKNVKDGIPKHNQFIKNDNVSELAVSDVLSQVLSVENDSVKQLKASDLLKQELMIAKQENERLEIRVSKMKIKAAVEKKKYLQKLQQVEILKQNINNLGKKIKIKNHIRSCQEDNETGPRSESLEQRVKKFNELTQTLEKEITERDEALKEYEEANRYNAAVKDKYTTLYKTLKSLINSIPEQVEEFRTGPIRLKNAKQELYDTEQRLPEILKEGGAIKQEIKNKELRLNQAQNRMKILEEELALSFDKRMLRAKGQCKLKIRDANKNTEDEDQVEEESEEDKQIEDQVSSKKGKTELIVDALSNATVLLEENDEFNECLTEKLQANERSLEKARVLRNKLHTFVKKTKYQLSLLREKQRKNEKNRSDLESSILKYKIMIDKIEHTYIHPMTLRIFYDEQLKAVQHEIKEKEKNTETLKEKAKSLADQIEMEAILADDFERKTDFLKTKVELLKSESLMEEEEVKKERERYDSMMETFRAKIQELQETLVRCKVERGLPL